MRCSKGTNVELYKNCRPFAIYWIKHLAATASNSEPLQFRLRKAAAVKLNTNLILSKMNFGGGAALQTQADRKRVSTGNWRITTSSRRMLWFHGIRKLGSEHQSQISTFEGFKVCCYFLLRSLRVVVVLWRLTKMHVVLTIWKNFDYRKNNYSSSSSRYFNIVCFLVYFR